MILIDTNLLARAAQPGHSQYAAAIAAVKAARFRGWTPCIVPQVVYEFWVVATRPLSGNGLGMTPSEAESDVLHFMRRLRLFRDERMIFDDWRQLVVRYDVQGKTGHDARLVAAMTRHGIDRLLTFNVRHFARFTEISVYHPDDLDVA